MIANDSYWNERFNHNDVYHVVTMVALYLFYLGIIKLKDCKDRRSLPSSPS